MKKILIFFSIIIMIVGCASKQSFNSELLNSDRTKVVVQEVDPDKVAGNTVYVKRDEDGVYYIQCTKEESELQAVLLTPYKF